MLNVCVLRKHKYLKDASFATGSRLVYKAPRDTFEVSRASGGFGKAGNRLK